MSPWCGYRLPENVDLILLKNPISADQRHGFNGRLRNQQAIERVPVAQGQSVQILYVIQRDGQQGDIIPVLFEKSAHFTSLTCGKVG
jgi:hypothetical protein